MKYSQWLPAVGVAFLPLSGFAQATYQPFTFTTLAGVRPNSAGAKFSYPGDVAVDGSGNVYVADSFNYTVRKITPTGVVTTLAGKPEFAPNVASIGGSVNGRGADARFNFPNDVAVDRDGNVYVADSGNHTIRKVTADG